MMRMRMIGMIGMMMRMTIEALSNHREVGSAALPVGVAS